MSTPSHDLRVTREMVSDLRTYHRNPRQGNTLVIAQSLTVNGQYRPVVANVGTYTGRPNEVLAGNHTLMAARDLGWERVAVTWVDVDDDQCARIVAADNRTADLAEYDERLLLELLADLPDLGGTGYEPGDLADLEKALRGGEEIPPGLTDPNDAPAVLPEPISKRGDVWLLGEHRLVVGDSTDPMAWETLLCEEKADCMWTDPPYGVAYVGKTKDALRIANDNLEGDGLADLLRGVFKIALASCRPGACWYVAAPPGPLHLQFARVLAELDVWRQTLVWVKDSLVMGHSDYHYRHEPIFYGWTPGAAHHPPPDRKQDTVFEVARPKRSEDHPTMKPVELIEAHVANSTDRGAVVVDPFAGSGSALIACHRSGRVARLVEIDARYADVICRRYQEHTGAIPILESTGAEHDFVRRGTEAA